MQIFVGQRSHWLSMEMRLRCRKHFIHPPRNNGRLCASSREQGYAGWLFWQRAKKPERNFLFF